VIRTARAMRLVSDDRLGNIGVENDEKTNEIVLTYTERYGRIGEHDGSCRNIGYQIGDVTYAATFKAIVVVFVIAGVEIVIRRDAVGNMIGMSALKLVSTQRRRRRQIGQRQRRRSVKNEDDRNQPNAQAIHLIRPTKPPIACPPILSKLLLNMRPVMIHIKRHTGR
jgi:hypothetical protein